MAARIAKSHVIDGCRYKSLNDVKYHKELKANPCVHSFKLPEIKEKSKYSRYGAHKCEINGIQFDSVMEGRYYAYCLLLKRQGSIKKMDKQITFTLQNGFTHKATGKKIRPITYIADFVIEMKNGAKYVIDVKGKKTPEFRIKEKMLLALNPDMNFLCVQWDGRKEEWRNLDDIEKDKRARKRTKKSTTKIN